jgi:hypothetical protein
MWPAKLVRIAKPAIEEPLELVADSPEMSAVET